MGLVLHPHLERVNSAHLVVLIIAELQFNMRHAKHVGHNCLEESLHDTPERQQVRKKADDAEHSPDETEHLLLLTIDQVFSRRLELKLDTALEHELERVVAVICAKSQRDLQA